jgi:hypothetical protein
MPLNKLTRLTLPWLSVLRCTTFSPKYTVITRNLSFSAHWRHNVHPVLDLKWSGTSRKSHCHVAYEVLTAAVMKSTVFWDITPCSPLKVNRLAICYHVGILARLIQPWRWRRYFSLKRRFTFNGLHSVISQKIVLLKRKVAWSCWELKPD